MLCKHIRALGEEHAPWSFAAPSAHHMKAADHTSLLLLLLSTFCYFALNSKRT